MNINKFWFTGNVTRDIELRTTSTGIATCSFNIAVNRPKAKDGTQTADFPTIVAWRQLAELCAKYLTKGSKIAVAGHVQTGSYEKDGKKIYKTDFVADDIEFLTRKQGEESGRASDTSAHAEQSASDDGDFVEVNDDDLPF